MADRAIGAIAILLVAVAATFLTLIAVNIALFFELRARIPQKPLSTSDAE